MALWEHLSEQGKKQLIEQNNPHKEQSGPYTGRCAKCESNNLWDDATVYGCNCCGAMFSNM